MTTFAECVALPRADAWPEWNFCAATCYDAVPSESCGGGDPAGSVCLRVACAALT